MYLLCALSLESPLAIRWGGIKLDMVELGVDGDEDDKDEEDKDEEDKDEEDKDEDNIDVDEAFKADEANEDEEDLLMEDKAWIISS